MEHTNQGYVLKFARDVDPEGNQKYTDVLPSFHAKYNVHENANLRFSYARSINRPSFFEIVPYSIINEDYKEKGNPDLKHTVADNIDVRYEFFPRSSEQFMVGMFYKKLDNPIEYGLINEGQDTYYKPMNFGTARNLGAEVDVMKYFNWFGIKANYTYTHSKVTTDKRVMDGSEVTSKRQSRPLFGQARIFPVGCFCGKELEERYQCLCQGFEPARYSFDPVHSEGTAYGRCGFGTERR